MIYISGAITGTTDYMKRFNNAENDLIFLGYDVVNPAKINANLPVICTHEDYMRVSIAELSICDTIYLLKGWMDSSGSREELHYAVEHGYKVLKEE